MRKEDAFTFLEVLLVISIISIILTISYPKYNGIISYAKIERVTREIVIFLRKSQQMALNNYSKYYLEIIDNNRIVVYEKDSSDYVIDKIFPKGVKISGKRTSFGPLGTAYRQTFRIDYKGKNTKVIVAPSGRIRRE